MKLLAVVPLRSGGWMRWTARVLALLIALFLSAAIIQQAIVEPPSWTSPDLGIGLGVFLLAAWVVVSMLAAWPWEKLGGLSSVLAGVATFIFVFVTSVMLESDRLPVALSLGVPSLIIGAAFLTAGRSR